jgi:hypothetical protein
MEPKMTPIIPIKQAIVVFAGREFLAVQLPGGDVAPCKTGPIFS